MNQTFIRMTLDNLQEFTTKHPTYGVGTTFHISKDLIENLDRDQITEINTILANARKNRFEINEVDGEIEIRHTTNTIYEAEPDARYEEMLKQVSVFRPRYRKLEPAEMELHEQIKNKAQELWGLFEEVEKLHNRGGREVAIGKTNLEQAVMWTVKGLTK